MPERLSPRALAAAAFCALALAAQPAPAQAPQKAEAGASVSGRVRLGEHGAPGITVGLIPSEFGPGQRAVARAKTDAEGFYRLANVPAGRYLVTASAPGYVIDEPASPTAGWLTGPSVTLAAGESLEGLDFELVRGGVITGRVTDAEGRPVVGESVRLMRLDREPRGRLPYSSQMWRTDDRGIYRLYGLPAGRYKVYVGVELGRGVAAYGPSERGYYARTFHPDVADEARAAVVEVTEGGEATGVDITLGRLSKTFRARGRIIDASTGLPAPGVTFGSDMLDPGSGRLLATGGGMRAQTNARGEFEVTGLLPGTYGAYALAESAPALYSEVVPFTVTDGDVAGLEVRLRAGASLSGVVSVEGLADRALLAQLLQRLTLYSYSDVRQGPSPPRFDRVRVGPDGSFQMTGLRPGRVSITVGYPPVRGLSLARVELNGAEQRGGIEVAEGAHVTGVRLVFVYGTGAIRGQVVVREGERPASLPPGARLHVLARRPGSTAVFNNRPAEVDSRGRFLIEGVPGGEVELMLNVLNARVRGVSQVVQVPEGGEASVVMTLDLSAAAAPGPPPPPRENR